MKTVRKMSTASVSPQPRNQSMPPPISSKDLTQSPYIRTHMKKRDHFLLA